MHIIDNMQSAIYDHAYNILKSKDLPPNCIDIEAQTKARRFINIYAKEHLLTDYYLRMQKGAV